MTGKLTHTTSKETKYIVHSMYQLYKFSRKVILWIGDFHFWLSVVEPVLIIEGEDN